MARKPDSHHVLPLFCDDLIASCVDMTPACFGAYMRLLCYAWTRGGLPDDEAACARIAGGIEPGDWAAIRSRLIVLHDGRLTHQRLELERVAVAEIREERSRAGRSGGQAKARNLANGKQTSSKTVANGVANAWQTPSKSVAPNPSPSLPSSSSLRSEEEIQQHTTTREDASETHRTRQEAPWKPDPSHEWDRLREAWNATQGVEPFHGFDFPRSDLVAARCSDPAWVRMYPDALARLPSCRFFDRPVSLRQFLGETFVADVLCGTYDHPKRGRTPAGAGSQPRKGGL